MVRLRMALNIGYRFPHETLGCDGPITPQSCAYYSLVVFLVLKTNRDSQIAPCRQYCAVSCALRFSEKRRLDAIHRRTTGDNIP